MKWKAIESQKIQEEWVIKNSFSFTKALVTKNIWRVIKGSCFWMEVVYKKHTALLLIIDWIHLLQKYTDNVSNIWKATIHSFDFIGIRLAWKIGWDQYSHGGICMSLECYESHDLISLSQRLSHSKSYYGS